MDGVTRYVVLVILSFWMASVPAHGHSQPPQLRLPTTVRPEKYSADLRMTPGDDRFSGSISIELEIAQPVSTIWLHAKSLAFEKATIRISGRDQPAQITPARNNNDNDNDNDFIAVTTGNALPAGHATLQIAYSGELSRTLTDGVFQQQAGSDWYIFTKFEPVTARRVFPCFDEPSFKVPWQLTLHVPRNLKAFSNTAIASEKDEANGTGGAGMKEANGMKEVRFEETKPLPSYLVAFAVGPFDVVETEPVGKNRRPSRIIVPRGRASEAAYAASITPKLIEMLEDYFGTPYPYEKLDQIVVPVTTAWGAMENAGLIAYGDFLLSPKEQDTELRQRNRAEAMEHEMSHQWFGDLVTTAWWDDLWLNEAFANWLSRKLLDEWKPEWNIKAEDAGSLSVMRSDSLTTARKIRQPIQAPGDIANAFDGITYGKGQAVIGMFENYIGPGLFQRAIRTYLAQHAWGNATSADLLAVLDSVSGQPIGAAFSTFLDQVGFPLISVHLACTETDGPETDRPEKDRTKTDKDRPLASRADPVGLTQHRFFPAGSPGATDTVWSVPVCATWGDDAGTHHHCSMLTKSAAPLDLLSGAVGCPQWLFADSNAAGYYAVSYDAAIADKLIEDRPSNDKATNDGQSHLKPDESAAMLRDIQLQFSSGVGDPAQELAFVGMFSHSSDPGLVRQAADTVGGLSDFVSADLTQNYARLIRSLYGKRAHELGWKPQAGEPQNVRKLRIEIVPLVAMEGEDQELSSEAESLAREWLQNRSLNDHPSNDAHQSLDPDMVEPVLSAAAWNGDRKFFDMLADAIKNDKIQRERSWMIRALPSFRDPSITRARLQLILDSGGGPKIDPRELQSTILISLPQTRETVWEFVLENFDALNSALPGARGIPFGAYLPLTAAGFCDAAHAQQVENFFQPRIARLSGGSRYLANTLERIRLCSARAAVIKPAVTNWLSKDSLSKN